MFKFWTKNLDFNLEPNNFASATSKCFCADAQCVRDDISASCVDCYY